MRYMIPRMIFIPLMSPVITVKPESSMSRVRQVRLKMVNANANVCVCCFRVSLENEYLSPWRMKIINFPRAYRLIYDEVGRMMERERESHSIGKYEYLRNADSTFALTNAIFPMMRNQRYKSLARTRRDDSRPGTE